MSFYFSCMEIERKSAKLEKVYHLCNMLNIAFIYLVFLVSDYFSEITF